MTITCTLSDGTQSYQWKFNPAVIQTSITNTTQEYQALSGSNTYLYFLGQSQSITVPLSIPGVHSDLNPTLTLLRKWTKNHTKLKLSYGSVLYDNLFLKSMSETIVQYRNGQPVSGDVSLEFIIVTQNKTPASVDTRVKTDREKAKT